MPLAAVIKVVMQDKVSATDYKFSLVWAAVGHVAFAGNLFSFQTENVASSTDIFSNEIENVASHRDIFSI